MSFSRTLSPRKSFLPGNLTEDLKRLRKTATALVLISTAGTAQATGPSETPVEAPVAAAAPAAPFWEGFYSGPQLGYVYGDFDSGSVAQPEDFNDDNVIGGLTLGYLWDVGNSWYMGPEFQYDFANVSVTDPDTGDAAEFDQIARL